MRINFDDVMGRIQYATQTSTQAALAEILEIKQSSISDAKRRNKIPSSWTLTLFNVYNAHPDWILYGTTPSGLTNHPKINKRNEEIMVNPQNEKIIECKEFSMIGKKVIIRTFSAGVHFGTLAEKKGNEVVLHDARRLWHWEPQQGICTHGIAKFGLNKKASRVCSQIDAVWLEAIEIILCTADAIQSIKECPDAHAW